MPTTTLPILVVDDQPIVAALLMRMLEALELAEVATAEDGCDALLAMRRRRYSLVIADIAMSPMTGLQMLRAMRREPGLQDVPVLMMTASRARTHHVEAREARVNGYLIKPFTIPVLREQVRSILTIWGGAAAQPFVASLPLPAPSLPQEAPVVARRDDVFLVV